MIGNSVISVLLPYHDSLNVLQSIFGAFIFGSGFALAKMVEDL
jgi:hypothetical protein